MGSSRLATSSSISTSSSGLSFTASAAEGMLAAICYQEYIVKWVMESRSGKQGVMYICYKRGSQ